MATKMLLLLLVFTSTFSSIMAFQMHLVEQWPPSVCASSSCIKIPKNFTLHGLWPVNSLIPPYVPKCSPAKFKFQHVMSLNSRLTSSWPNLLVGITDQIFWEHEWKKHGSCSSLTQLGYFKLALDLKDKFDILKELQLKFPPGGTTYAAIDIANAIKATNHYMPQLKCKWYGNKVYLNEVVRCFEHGLQGINCPNSPWSANGPTNCTGQVAFPA